MKKNMVAFFTFLLALSLTPIIAAANQVTTWGGKISKQLILSEDEPVPASEPAPAPDPTPSPGPDEPK